MKIPPAGTLTCYERYLSGVNRPSNAVCGGNVCALCTKETVRLKFIMEGLDDAHSVEVPREFESIANFTKSKLHNSTLKTRIRP